MRMKSVKYRKIIVLRYVMRDDALILFSNISSAERNRTSDLAYILFEKLVFI